MSEQDQDQEVEVNAILKKYLAEDIKEKARERKFSRFFKSGILLYFFVPLFVYFYIFGVSQIMGADTKKHIALVEIHGTIGESSDVDSKSTIKSLKAAFKNEQSVAIVLEINSGGGSPVTSYYIYNEIMKLKKEYNKPVYAVITETGASGAYYISLAADKIVADKASIVGSIGARIGGFGFTGIMNKLGVERRIVSSGENKTIGDPFSELKTSDEVHLKELVTDIHKQFKEVVIERRGDKLDLSNTSYLFSGLFWTGEKALELGLIDEINNIYDLNDKYFDELPYNIYTTKETGFLASLLPGLSMNLLGDSNMQTSMENRVKMSW